MNYLLEYPGDPYLQDIAEYCTEQRPPQERATPARRSCSTPGFGLAWRPGSANSSLRQLSRPRPHGHGAPHSRSPGATSELSAIQAVVDLLGRTDIEAGDDEAAMMWRLHGPI